MVYDQQNHFKRFTNFALLYKALITVLFATLTIIVMLVFLLQMAEPILQAAMYPSHTAGYMSLSFFFLQVFLSDHNYKCSSFVKGLTRVQTDLALLYSLNFLNVHLPSVQLIAPSMHVCIPSVVISNT